MSQINVTNIQHETGAGSNITLDASGNVVCAADVQMASLNSSFLSGFRNQIINGGLNVWQTGTTVGIPDSTPTYAADRWNMRSIGSAQTVYKVGAPGSTVGSLPAGFSGGIESNQTSGATIHLCQGIELARTGNAGIFANGTQWTMSVWANFDLTAEDTFRAQFVDQVGFATTPDIVTAFEQSWVSTGQTSNGWTRYQATGTISGTPNASATCLRACIYFDAGEAIGGGRRALTGCQFEPGPVATPFEHRPIAMELAMCQRYFYRMNVEPMEDRNFAKSPYNFGGAPPNSSMNSYEAFPVTMRVAPTIDVAVSSDNLQRATASLMGVGFKFTDNVNNATASVSGYFANAEL